MITESDTYVSPVTQWAPIIIVAANVLIVVAIISLGVYIFKKVRKKKE